MDLQSGEFRSHGNRLPKRFQLVCLVTTEEYLELYESDDNSFVNVGARGTYGSR